MSETTSARLLARLRATPGDLAGLDAEIQEAERHLERLRLLRELLAAVPPPTGANGAANGGASEEAPFAPAAAAPRPRRAYPPKPPTEKVRAAARLLADGPIHFRDLAARLGISPLGASPLLTRAAGYFRPLGEGVYGLTDAGRALAASAPDAGAASGTACPAPPNGTAS